MERTADSDRYAEIGARLDAHHHRPESEAFGKALHDMSELAEGGHVDAAEALAEILALPGPNYDPESAYKWY